MESHDLGDGLQRSRSVPNVVYRHGDTDEVEEPEKFKRTSRRSSASFQPAKSSGWLDFLPLPRMRRRSAEEDGSVVEGTQRRMSVEEFISPSASSSARIPEPSPDCHAGSSGIEKQLFDNPYSSAVFNDYELRLEVFSATELKAPEYRVGDGLRSLMGGDESLLWKVYIEFELGERTARTAGTARMDKEEDRSAFFDDEKMLLTYNGEKELKVKVRNQRRFGAVVRGDPLIGEGCLSLGRELQDGKPRCYVVSLERDSVPSGFVSLQCQAFSASWEAARAHREHVDDELAAFGEVMNASDDAGNFLESLKFSSESFNMACGTESFQQELAARF